MTINIVILLLKYLNWVECCSVIRPSKTINSRVLHEVLIRIQVVGIIVFLVAYENSWILVVFLFFVKGFIILIFTIELVKMLFKKTVNIMTVKADWN